MEIEVAPYTRVNSEVILDEKGKDWKRKCRDTSLRYLSKICINLHQTNTKMIFRPFYRLHVVEYFSPAKTRIIAIFVCI